MHISETVTLTTLIEDSVHYQNEDVFFMYGIIFLCLAVICLVYYQYSKQEQRKHLKRRQQ